MMGWVVAAVVWALGIYPSYSGLVETAKSDQDYLELETTEKRIADGLIVVCGILWPVCAIYELAVEVLGPKEGGNNDRE